MIPSRQRCLSMTSIRIVASFVLAILPSLGSVCERHPNHFSTAEVRWNDQTGNFEIALNVWPPDLEKAISKQAGKAIDLDKGENLDELIAALVRKNFSIRKTSALKANEKVTVVTSDDASTEKGAPGKVVEEGETDKPEAVEKPAPAEPAPKVADSANMEATKLNQPESIKTETETEIEAQSANSDGEKKSGDASDTKLVDKNVLKKADFDENGFRWVGFEATLKEAWLYFEIKGDAEVTQWQIENRIFFEFNEEQVNQVRLNCGKEAKSYSLKQNDPSYRFETEKKGRLGISAPKK